MDFDDVGTPFVQELHETTPVGTAATVRCPRRHGSQQPERPREPRKPSARSSDLFDMSAVPCDSRVDPFIVGGEKAEQSDVVPLGQPQQELRCGLAAMSRIEARCKRDGDQDPAAAPRSA
jgi:hypothetical protein